MYVVNEFNSLITKRLKFQLYTCDSHKMIVDFSKYEIAPTGFPLFLEDVPE